jgi:ubiquinone/menaquinone biosynthesis C-methylase UbiE
MTQKSKTNYAALKRSVYREYSRSYDEDRDRFVSGAALMGRIDWALGLLQPGKNLLDLGCGSGQLLLQAADRTNGKGLLTGLDLTPDMLRLAKLELGGGVSLVEGNAATALPFKEKSFDVVTSLNLVQELPTEAVTSLFHEVYLLLRPGGVFRAVIPCMADSNPAADRFRQMAQARGLMDFRYADDLEILLAGMTAFAGIKTEFRLSTAAANAAKGNVRFSLFADILKEIENEGLDPSQVQQGVIFFSGRRGTDT